MSSYYINVNNELAFVAKNDEEFRNYMNTNNLTIVSTDVDFGRDYITVIAA